MLVLAVLFGSMTGVALGLTGGGGAVLALPALVYGLGQPVAQAVPTSLLVVAVSSAAGLAPRLGRGQVRWPVAGIFGATGAAAAFAGTAVNRMMPARALLGLFALLMVIVGVRMLRSGSAPEGACAVRGGRINWRACLAKALLTGAGVGFVTGLLGVGGGFVTVPALMWLLGLELPAAVATSLAILVINSLAGLAAHLGETRLDMTVTGIFAGAALAASLAAGRLASRVPQRVLRRGFAVLVLVVAAFVAVQTAINPGVLG
ncbi:sulfite exporter TauE/SafE family protein [Streptomyces oryzae]|uniref:Probable membrane transporter protein n=1 Tax=Streptomyces oryzae TaxID=1434886 RepID=A0ABS3X555_9ACTN|nr:sulfite exporter TauE/SafE family protein [Streptomyces oryzae]MBO8190498.1 sulfite exporter TauE/SafE family protein [Streptomyces oryzae]